MSNEECHWKKAICGYCFTWEILKPLLYFSPPADLCAVRGGRSTFPPKHPVILG